MVKKKIKIFFRIGLSFLFVVFLSINVDWRIIITAFKEINLSLYVVSTILTLFSSLFVAGKYYLLIKDTSISQSIPSLIKINLISRFYALFLPSAIGTEAIRWYKVTRNERGRIFFLATTIFERSFFILVLLLSGLIPLFFYSSNSEIMALRLRIFPVVILLLSIVCFFIAYFIFPIIRSSLNSIINRLSIMQFKNIDIDSSLKIFTIKSETSYIYIHIFILSIIWQVVFICRIFTLFKAVVIPLNFVDITWMGSLVLLLQILPISYAGIGIREGAYAYLFTIFKLPPEKGVLIGTLFFSQMLILAGLGGLFEIMDK